MVMNMAIAIGVPLVAAGLTAAVMSYVWSGSVIEWYQRRRTRRTSKQTLAARAEAMCRKRQARTRLGEFLRCSHPEWN